MILKYLVILFLNIKIYSSFFKPVKLTGIEIFPHVVTDVSQKPRAISDIQQMFHKHPVTHMKDWMSYSLVIKLTIFLFLKCQVPSGFRGFVQVFPSPYRSVSLSLSLFFLAGLLIQLSLTHSVGLVSISTFSLRPSLSTTVNAQALSSGLALIHYSILWSSWHMSV